MTKLRLEPRLLRFERLATLLHFILPCGCLVLLILEDSCDGEITGEFLILLGKVFSREQFKISSCLLHPLFMAKSFGAIGTQFILSFGWQPFIQPDSILNLPFSLLHHPTVSYMTYYWSLQLYGCWNVTYSQSLQLWNGYHHMSYHAALLKKFNSELIYVKLLVSAHKSSKNACH